ncbi:T9SS type A sorting domain-containing protein [Longitalea luteola]|uniref:T9SS type A sorting domain-containing protein n=1 Tax=Longitalea luteola TaxID=2812563 RepID=UPI001A9587D5|nr:T9SS type A sorting domain-containing protein [Longitalea luteola]
MKTFYILCTCLVLSMQQTVAQSVVLDWATSLLTGWLNGGTTGTANNIGSSLVNAQINISNSRAGSYAYSSPKVSNEYVSALGSNADNLFVGVDWDSESDYADITIAFNAPVTNVRFNVADIDMDWLVFHLNVDEIVVTGTSSTNTTVNPTITKLVASSDIVRISGNRAYAATLLQGGGNSASNAADQNGTVVVDFGNTLLNQVRIRYRNNSASISNPTAQYIVLGNISFQPAIVLPLTLTSFNGSLNNNTVKLNWSTAQEENLGQFVVEKSVNGIDWLTLTTVQAAGNSNSTREYNAVDDNAFSVNYYRLKQVDMSGNYSYSQTIRIRSTANEKSTIRAYPNPAANTATITINSENKLAAHIKLYNQFGLQLQHLQRPLIAGSNNIPVPGIQALPSGTYIITVEDATGKKIGTTQLIKQ